MKQLREAKRRGYATPSELLEVEIGSPCYLFTYGWCLKQAADEAVKHVERLGVPRTLVQVPSIFKLRDDQPILVLSRKWNNDWEFQKV